MIRNVVRLVTAARGKEPHPTFSTLRSRSWADFSERFNKDLTDAATSFPRKE